LRPNAASEMSATLYGSALMRVTPPSIPSICRVAT
jgi:hypothetical protein